MGLSIPVIYGSVRSDRQGIRVARYLVAELEGRGHQPVLVDPLVQRLPLLDRMYKEYQGDAPPVLEELARLYRDADVFLIVSGEYNNGVPPALKNLLDHFLEEYYWRPSAIASYSAGQFGGVRGAMSLRMILSELGMPSIPSILAVPHVSDAVDEHGALKQPRLAKTTTRFLDEMAWYARALAAERAKGVPY